MENKKKNNQEAVSVTKSYPYTGRSCYSCKIDAVPQPPVFKCPKGWSPEIQIKLDKLRLQEAQQKEKADK